MIQKIITRLISKWQRFWMRFAGLSHFGRLSCWLASWVTPPHYAREYLARIHKNCYVSIKATISHKELILGQKAFIDDNAMIYQNKDGKYVNFGEAVRIYRGTTIETGRGGHVKIGNFSSIHPRGQLNAYLAPIEIGDHVMIAANCALYSYDHGVAADTPIRRQPLTSKGPIIIKDEAWIGTGVIILSGVTIGEGAIIGAGSVVTKDVPDYTIAIGNPARVVKKRPIDEIPN